MKKKLGVSIFILIFTLLIIYFGVEGINSGNINNSKEFITVYLDNFQRYFYLITLLVCGIILNLEFPFYNAEIAIRVENLPFFLIKYYLPIILLSSTLVLFIFLIVCLIFGYNEPLKILNVNLFMRIFNTIMSYFIIYNTCYCITKKVNKSLMFLIIFNFIFLIIGLSIQYYINPTINMMLILNYYNIFISLLGIAILYFKIKKMELLSSDIS